MTKKRSADVADKDEDWDGPVEEASVPIAERMETLEAGGTPEEIVTEAVPPIEERVARLERIAEYLHEARKEAATLAGSVDTLAEATRALTNLLVTIESQQKSIEALGRRADAADTGAEKFRDRIRRRAFASALALVLVIGGIGGAFLTYQRTQEADALMRCEARNEQAEIIVDILRGVLVGADEADSRTEVIRQGLARFEVLIIDCEGGTL